MSARDYPVPAVVLAMALVMRLAGAALAPVAPAPVGPPPAFCGGVPPVAFDQPLSVPHQGWYLNRVYRYGVRIPAGFSAFTAAMGPERGFAIPLSMSPRAYIQVDALYDAFYDITPAGVHRRDLNAVTLHHRVLTDQVAATALSHRDGGRYLTDVQCPPDPQTYRHDAVIVMVNREIYRVDLLTVPERYAADVRVMNALLQSWRWNP